MLSSLPSTKKYFLIMFLISCVLLEAFTLVIYYQSRTNKNSNDWVLHSYEVLHLGRLILIDSIDLASQEQGYMLTGYPTYLSSYETIRSRLNDKLDQLDKSTKDNTEQQMNVMQLHDKVDYLIRLCSAHMDAVSKKQTSLYSIKADMNATKASIAEVRSAFDSFSVAESELLDTRTQAAESEQKNYTLTILMGGILGLGALIIANMVIFSLIAKNSRAEEKLRKTEELFSIVLAGINDGIYDHNVPQGTMEFSTSYQNMLGYSEKELGSLQKDFSALIHPDDAANVREVFDQYIAKEIPTYYNVFRLRHKDGHWVWVLSRGVGIWDEKGHIQRMIGSHTDITAQKQREEELNYFIHENEVQRNELAQAKEKAEAANQAKSDFLATMSHEIRTPMNVVVGLARLMLETSLDAKQRKMMETLDTNTDVLLRLVNDLLDLSRIESGQVELEVRPFTLEDIFKELHAMFAGPVAAKGLTLTLDNHVGGQSFVGDAMRIQQILVNLIGNALKFTEQGGITVTSEYELQHDSKIDLRFIVADTGAGIPSEKLPTIFEKFVQADQTISRRFGGSGLGLSICLSLAQLMGGDISVTSMLGKGSTFTVSLCLQMNKQKKIAPLSATPKARTAQNGSQGTVLVVEDYTANVMVVSMMLENLGYEIDVASCGAEAIQKVQLRDTPFAAILMDVQMQDMDGLETTRRIRKLEDEKGFRHLIVGATAHALAGDRDRCIEAGMDDYMSKPIHPDLLAEKLSALRKAA